MAAKYDFTIEQGATFTKRFTWKTADGELKNLTGFTAKLQARFNYSSPTPYFTLTETDGITLGGAEGTVLVTLTPEQTTNLRFKTAVYDLELTAPDGSVKRLVEGYVTLSKEATK